MFCGRVRSAEGSFSSDASSAYEADYASEVAGDPFEHTQEGNLSQQSTGPFTKQLNFYRPFQAKANSVDIVPTSSPHLFTDSQAPKADGGKKSADAGCLNRPKGATLKKTSAVSEQAKTIRSEHDRAAVFSRYFSKQNKENTYKTTPTQLEIQLKNTQNELTECLQRLSDANCSIASLSNENSRLKAQILEMQQAHDHQLAEETCALPEVSSKTCECKFSYEKLKAECTNQQHLLEQLTAQLTENKTHALNKSLVKRLDELEAKFRSVQIATPVVPSNQDADDIEITKNAHKIKELETLLYKGSKPLRLPRPLSKISKTNSSLIEETKQHGCKNPVVQFRPKEKARKSKQLKKKRAVSAELRWV